MSDPVYFLSSPSRTQPHLLLVSKMKEIKNSIPLLIESSEKVKSAQGPSGLLLPELIPVPVT